MDDQRKPVVSGGATLNIGQVSRLRLFPVKATGTDAYGGLWMVRGC